MHCSLFPAIRLVGAFIVMFSGGLGAAETMFTRLSPEACGIDFKNPIDEAHPDRHMYASGNAVGSVTVADFNGDDKPDLFFSGGPVSNALYLQDSQDQGLHFSQVICGVESPQRWAGGAAAIDIDQDGDQDLYVTNYDTPNELFINEGIIDGKLKFTEQAKDYGLDFSGASLMPCFADFDKDGDLDLFLLTYHYILKNGHPNYSPAKLEGEKVVVDKEWDRYFEGVYDPAGKHKLNHTGAPDRLYRNEGKGKNGKVSFSDVTKSSGISGRTFGLSAAWLDYDHDGYPDIYVASDFDTPDKLWRNNGDGTFADVHQDVVPYCAWSSMGMAHADFDGNGLVDLIVPDMGGSTHFKSKVNMGVLSDERRRMMVEVKPQQTMRNCLLLDSGVGKFYEAAYMSGLAKTDWTWSSKAGDFDNDGKVDVFFTNGVARNFSDSDHPYTLQHKVGTSEWDHYKMLPPAKDTNRAFQNQGDLKFTNVSKAWGLDHLGMSYASAVADLDLDGDLDLVTCNLDEEIHILLNQQQGKNGLVISLKGKPGNSTGIGAIVTVESEKLGKQVRLNQPMAGFLSYESTHLHFGLGDDRLAKLIHVLWPDGTEQEVGNLEVGKLHVIDQKNAKPAQKKLAVKKLFMVTGSGPQFNHKENDFKDYDDFLHSQPLLPIRLSRGGPAMAWADIDGDGDDDVYFGGARYQPGELHLNQGQGKFLKAEGPWSKDASCEDMGALWLDADADGDLDLYVSSGTAASFAGSSAMRDRLYLNEGGGKFSKASQTAIPSAKLLSSTVAAADIDRDGDLDLFVGTRAEVGQYPLTPESRILRNDGTPGKPLFTDVTTDIATGLRRVGMVTSATWSDLNNNGWQDLLLAIDYGPVKIFLNEKGKLLEMENLEGVSSKLGWWNSIATADLDGDGRMDIIAGNMGLNTKYKTLDEKKTIKIFYGDFTDSGRSRIVESKQSAEKDAPLPVRGKG